MIEWTLVQYHDKTRPMDTSLKTHWDRDEKVAICRRHFETYFREWKYLNSNEIEIFTDIYSQGSNWQYASVWSVNGLSPNRWQTTIWTNDGLLYCRYAYMCRCASMNQHKYSICKNMHSFFLAFCQRNPLVTGGFLPQRTCNVELWCFRCC